LAAKPTTIDDYIASFPADVQAILQEVRRIIRNAVPAADETISYGIPTFTFDGRYLVYFAGWKRHISVYPVPTGDATFEREIDPFRAGKGTLKFPLDKPIPYDLIERVTALLVQERTSGGAADA
jgi:uncharacterized protein YdhG (YjbR/CyaY superfamily)